MKIYERYTYGAIVWFWFEVLIPWGLVCIGAMPIYYTITRMKFNIGFIIYGLIIFMIIGYYFFKGAYWHSIKALVNGIWTTLLTPEGIYGKRAIEKILFFLPYRLLSGWEDIERVEYRRARFDPDIGYIRVVKTNGKKFDISYRRVAPYHLGPYNPDQYIKGSVRGISVEMAGIMAWKVGIGKMIGFPEREEPTSNGNRKYILAMDTIIQIVNEIKTGKLPFKKIDGE